MISTMPTCGSLKKLVRLAYRQSTTTPTATMAKLRRRIRQLPATAAATAKAVIPAITAMKPAESAGLGAARKSLNRIARNTLASTATQKTGSEYIRKDRKVIE